MTQAAACQIHFRWNSDTSAVPSAGSHPVQAMLCKEMVVLFSEERWAVAAWGGRKVTA